MSSCLSCLSNPVLSVCDVGVLWPNGWTDQDETWQADRPHCVRWEPSSPFVQGGGGGAPNFRPIPVWPNGWLDQDATWYGGTTRPRRLCVGWGPSSPPQFGIILKVCITRMLAINVSIPNLTVARLVQFPSPQMTDNNSSFTLKSHVVIFRQSPFAANAVPKLFAMATSLRPAIWAMSSLDTLSPKTNP